MDCPSCGSSDYYVGFTERDCGNSACKFYKARDVKKEKEEHCNDECEVSCDGSCAKCRQDDNLP